MEFLDGNFFCEDLETDSNNSAVESNYSNELKDTLKLYLQYLVLDEDNEDGKFINEWVEDQIKEARFETEHGMRKTPVISQLFHLLRECLLTHRWPEAVKLMTGVSVRPHQTLDVIKGVGMEVFFHTGDGEDNHSLLNQLVRFLCDLEEVGTRELVVDFMLYLLSQDKIDEAKQQFVKGGFKMPRLRLRDNITIYKAYQGLMHYIQWLEGKHKLQKLQQHPEEFSDSSRISLGSQITHDAEKALSNFKDLYKERGVWDIFITKQIEIMEYLGEIEEGETVLKDYAEKTPTNPNALRIYYQYMKRHNGSDEQLIDILQAFCQMVPSDELVFELHSLLLKKDAAVSVTLPVLFDMLDYPCWTDDTRPWELLARQLKNICKRQVDTDLEVTRSCWSIRQSWWPQYHFQHKQIIDGTEDTLIYKAAVATFLLGKDNEYAKQVKENVKSDITMLKKARKLVRKKGPLGVP